MKRKIITIILITLSETTQFYQNPQNQSYSYTPQTQYTQNYFPPQNYFQTNSPFQNYYPTTNFQNYSPTKNSPKNIQNQSKSKSPKVLTNFEVSRYMGTWYEQARTPNFFERKEAKNIKAIYTLLPDSSVRVENSSENNGPKKGLIFGTARFKGEKNVADLDLVFERKGYQGRISPKGNYRVVGTDYVSYAFVYSREKFGLREVVNAWILTREKNFRGMEFVFEEILKKFLMVTGLKREELIFPVQDDLY